jgi:hypothetical protein
MRDADLTTASELAHVEAVIRAKLLAEGSISEDVATLPVNVSAWRAAARRVAKSLARPTWTGLDPQGQVVWAELADWPTTADEEARQRAATRRAIPAPPDVG